MVRLRISASSLRHSVASALVVGILATGGVGVHAAADPGTLNTVRQVVAFLKANGIDCTGLKAVGTDKYGGKYGRCTTFDGPVTVRAYKSVAASKQADYWLHGKWHAGHCSGKYRNQALHIIYFGNWILETRSLAIKDTVIDILHLKQNWKLRKGHMWVTCDADAP
jgi:hypothetical protein